MNIKPIIQYIKPSGVSDAKLVPLSDAAYGAGSYIYGKSEYITGLLIKSLGGRQKLFQAIDWSRQKHEQVSYSAFSVEIVAATNADFHVHDLKFSFIAIFKDLETAHEIYVDSRELFDTITTLHVPM